MATPNAGVLDTVLNTFRTQIDTGYAVLQGPVAGTLGTLIVITMVLMALFWALDESGSIWSPIIRKALVIGWWSYLILNWQNMAINVVFTSFGTLGAQVGNAGGLSGFLNSPSKIVALGIGDGQVLVDLASYYLGNSHTPWGVPPVTQPVGLDLMAAFTVVLSSLFNALEAFFAALLIFIAFFWLALEVVVATIEFHIVILIAFCVLPFGVFERTASYAERALSYVISAGFKVMALGVVIGLSQGFLVNYQLTYTPGSLPGLDAMGGMALGILVILMLAISAPKYAQAIISGSASTGMGQLAGAAGLAAGAGLATVGAAKAAVGAIQGAPQAASGAAGLAKSVWNGTMLGGNGSSQAAASSGGSPGAAGTSASGATSAADLASTIAPAGGDAASAPAGGSSSSPAGQAAGSADSLAETIAPPAQVQGGPAPTGQAQASSVAASGQGSTPAPPAPSAPTPAQGSSAAAGGQSQSLAPQASTAGTPTQSSSAAAAGQGPAPAPSQIQPKNSGAAAVTQLTSTIQRAAENSDGSASPPPTSGSNS